MRPALLLLLVGACVKNDPVGYTPDGRYYYEPSPPPLPPRPDTGAPELQVGEPDIRDAGPPDLGAPDVLKPAPTWI